MSNDVDDDDGYDKHDDDSATLPWISCWHPVSMGATIVNDDGAISIMPLGTPARNDAPVTERDDDDDDDDEHSYGNINVLW